jgi:hypothetical protein
MATSQLVCQHYLRLYAWKQHLAFPSLANAVKWAGRVGWSDLRRADGAAGLTLCWPGHTTLIGARGRP